MTIKENVELLNIIKKGGSVPENEEVKEKLTPISVYIPKAIHLRIQESCKKRQPRFYSKTNWVIDAILEKLQKEEKHGIR